VNILTWNIQATKGCDNRFDVVRIVEQVKQLGDFDAICLQEVARYIPDLNADDQLALICEYFADYDAIWGPGFSVPSSSGRFSEFGNLTLVKVGRCIYSRVHSLPSPRVDTWQIPRIMIETVITIGERPLTLFNTHLAFHSEIERIAQIQALTRLRNLVLEKAGVPASPDVNGPYQFTYTSDAVLLCGDLNMDLNDEVFKNNVSQQHWIDCWSVQSRYAGQPKPARPPTCGCFDHVQWPQGPHIRDVFLATENIANNTVRVDVDVNTDASDHQPVVLEIDL